MPRLRCSRFPAGKVKSSFNAHFVRVPNALGLAVSGGSDSLGLLSIAREWAAEHSVQLAVATVDHGLRPEAKEEAAYVADLCRSWGIPHSVLTWSDHPQNGNLMAEARSARYRLIADWAKECGIQDVALGHTSDDNAETFVMGLMRGAGLDGLSGMRGQFEAHGIHFHRPLLGVSRSNLRTLLREREIRWVDDPTNDDEHYDRVRVRKALAGLSGLGLEFDKSISNLRATRSDLMLELWSKIESSLSVTPIDVQIEERTFLSLTPEFRRRFFNVVLRYVSGSDYPPRADKVQRLVCGGYQETATLAGALVYLRKGVIHITRELNKVQNLEAKVGEVWDSRAIANGPNSTVRIRALGENGLRQIGAIWRETENPRRSLISSPAIWEGEKVIFAPYAGVFHPDWEINCKWDVASLRAFVLTH